MKMKNKKEEQRQKRKKHRAELRKAKRQKREQSPDLNRDEPYKKEKQKILIVCEGKLTEPSYFEKFKLSTATIRAVGEGYNTLSLVQRAIELSEEDDYDQVWCVFDKDDFPNEHFNNAIYKAKGRGFKAAYSNQAFEYWLLLHFEDHQGGAMHRDKYCKKINEYLRQFKLLYSCNNKQISDGFFEILQSKIIGTDQSRQDIACKRAARNFTKNNIGNPAQEESSTKVYELIKVFEEYK